MSGFVSSNFISTKVFIKDNKVMLLYITLFTTGITLGTVSLWIAGEKSNTLVSVIKTYLEENASLSIIGLFSRNIISSLVYIAVIYIGGLCAIGVPFVAIIPLVKGVALGSIISYQYVFSGIHGFLYTLTILVIPNALLLAVMSYAYTEGLYMSLNVSNGIFNGKPRQVKYSLSFITFTKRFIIFSFAVVLITFAESVLCFVFAKVV